MKFCPRGLRGLALVGAALAGGLLVGCSVLPPAQAVTVYLLPGALPARSAEAPVDWALRVATPQSSLALDNTRVAVVPQPNQISAYQGARWSDPAPALVRERLLQTFQADGRVRALSSDSKPLYADLLLVSELRAFQSEYREGAVQVVIQLDARLVRSANQRVEATRRFAVSQAVSGTQVPEVVAAFGTASDALAAQVLAWTLEQGRSAPPAAVANAD